MSMVSALDCLISLTSGAQFIFNNNILLLFALSFSPSFIYVMLLHFIGRPIELEDQHSISSAVAIVEIYGWVN